MTVLEKMARIYDIFLGAKSQAWCRHWESVPLNQFHEVKFEMPTLRDCLEAMTAVRNHLYIVYNEFDEKVRLVRACTEEEAINKAKNSISKEDIKLIIEENVKKQEKTNNMLLEAYKLANKEPEIPLFDPKEWESMNLNDYNWEVLQKIENQDVTVIENVTF